MLKKLLYTTLILIFSVILVFAKEKAAQLKKFQHAAVGNPEVKGSATIQDDGLQIIAGGADVWGAKDQFHFSYIEKTGDFDLIARIESLSAPHLYTKAGLMAREELSENSSHIFFQVFPNNKPRNKNNGGYEFQYRSTKAENMKAIYPAKAEGAAEFPVNYPETWIRLKREGDVFTGFWSADGKTWKVYTSYSQVMSKKIYLGMAVTSHNIKESAVALFKDISFIY